MYVASRLHTKRLHLIGENHLDDAKERGRPFGVPARCRRRYFQSLSCARCFYGEMDLQRFALKLLRCGKPPCSSTLFCEEKVLLCTLKQLWNLWNLLVSWRNLAPCPGLYSSRPKLSPHQLGIHQRWQGSWDQFTMKPTSLLPQMILFAHPAHSDITTQPSPEEPKKKMWWKHVFHQKEKTTTANKEDTAKNAKTALHFPGLPDSSQASWIW